MIGERSLRELVRTVSVSYAVPYASTLLVIGGLICFTLAATISHSPLAWLFGGVGGLAIVSGAATVLYAVLMRPELVRHERYVSEQRLLDIVTDIDQDADARAVAGDVLLARGAQAEVPKLKDDQMGASLNARGVSRNGR